jgi:hypothetical protein
MQNPQAFHAQLCHGTTVAAAGTSRNATLPFGTYLDVSDKDHPIIEQKAVFVFLKVPMCQKVRVPLKQ